MRSCPWQRLSPIIRPYNFLQWFIKEQLEEVASMEQLLRVVQRASEGNLLRVEEYLARQKGAESL